MHHTIYSIQLHRYVHYEVFLPAEYTLQPSSKFPLLVLNDGQDAEKLKLAEILHHLVGSKQIKPLVVVAVHCGERKQEYGVAGIPDYAGRGSKADKYEKFLICELLPIIEAKYPVSPEKEHRAIAGFSLGGLSAFDIAWRNPQLFSKVGVFSGSFWWRSKALDDGYTPADRIMHREVRQTANRPSLRFWFQTSHYDEHADRDFDGIIDAIGDTVDLIIELKKKGYMLGTDIRYVDYPAGGHDLETMARVLPDFLIWAFPTIEKVAAQHPNSPATTLLKVE